MYPRSPAAGNAVCVSYGIGHVRHVFGACSLRLGSKVLFIHELLTSCNMVARREKVSGKIVGAVHSEYVVDVGEHSVTNAL